MKQHLIQAAERGNAEAQFNLAIMYENGLVDSRYVAEGNHSEAMKWLSPPRTGACPRPDETRGNAARSPTARYRRASGTCWRRARAARSFKVQSAYDVPPRFDTGSDRGGWPLCARLGAEGSHHRGAPPTGCRPGVRVNVMATGLAEGADEQSLARDMLDVHGPKAAVVARGNARAAALAGQREPAKFWIRVLGLIQQRGTDKDERLDERGCRSTARSTQG